MASLPANHSQYFKELSRPDGAQVFKKAHKADTQKTQPF